MVPFSCRELGMPVGRNIAVASSVAGRRRQSGGGDLSSRHDSRPARTASAQLHVTSATAPPSRAATLMTKALKEAATLGRRATYSWRKWTGNGVLVFDDSMSGTRRIFAIGKMLGEGGYSTIWQVP